MIAYYLFRLRQALRCWRPRQQRATYGTSTGTYAYRHTQWLFWSWTEEEPLTRWEIDHDLPGTGIEPPRTPPRRHMANRWLA